MAEEIYSYTSNTAKLLKHLDELKNIQNGKVAPIMVHSIPTHKCQLNCVHCCFKNRKDRNAQHDLDEWKEGILQFSKLGTRALEYTGGGDPTLWSYINEGTEYAKGLGYHIGIITNGVGVDKIHTWDCFDWVRVSLNTLDYKDDLDISLLRKHDVVISFCYIWNEFSERNIKKVIDFANYHKIVCRLAPDCIKPLNEIDESVEYIRKYLTKFPENKYVFLSDFNIDTVRKNNDCRIHMIKPCFYLDGWVYACPSAELAVENNKQIQHKARVCRYNDIISFYKSEDASKPRDLDCSYCKYVKQQEFLEDLLMETKFNEFA